jgi:(2R)-sulfolactate sulfo-lyase subunit alpha
MPHNPLEIQQSLFSTGPDHRDRKKAGKKRGDARCDRIGARCYIWPRIPHCKSPNETPVTIHFVVHEEGDSVGTIVVEGVKAGDALTGWIMEQDKTVDVKTLSDIPIGHKIALKELKNGDTVIKYGVDIGKVVKPIAKGEHLHVHNVKTKRW